MESREREMKEEREGESGEGERERGEERMLGYSARRHWHLEFIRGG